MQTKIKPLPANKLFTPCRDEQFSFQTTDELDEVDVVIGQERAMDALQFGIRIAGKGYNVFALGPSGAGKLTAVTQAVTREADKHSAPSDWCYVNDFECPFTPKALPLPPGRGQSLRQDMDQLIDELGTTIEAAFEGDEYRSRVEEIQQQAKERETKAMHELKEIAKEKHIILVETPNGFAFAPMNADGEVLDPKKFEKLAEDERNKIQQRVAGLQEQLQKLLKQFPVWRKETRENLKAQNREIARLSVSHLIESIINNYLDLPVVLDYLESVQQDIIDHVDQFFTASEDQSPLFGGGAPQEPFKRYEVNLVVDHEGKDSAPVVYEDLPCYGNLIGRIEYQAQMGVMVTDFTMIKAGALHRANGGYLILDARKLLMQPFAWESLKRTMQSGVIRLESLERSLSLVSTTSLEPEPIPLDAKVILFGDRKLYYLLNHYDPEFIDLFKVAADFEDTIDRNSNATHLFASAIANLAREENLLPLGRSGVGRIIEYSARMASDSEKLSTHLRSLSDLLRESDYWTKQGSEKIIERKHVQQAIDHQIQRADRVRRRIYEEIQRGTILIETKGEVVGQINGLSVVSLADFSFGQSTRITATTRLGEGKVIDIERETKLGGAIHSKGVLILSSFLAYRYARKHPFSLNASLVFEQSYGKIEGDSASMAELCVLISSLANVPIKQNLAITGSVNQHGVVQPIGGVNEKIEGFFDICKMQGASPGQGVIIPESNVKHLMLRHDVVEAAKEGQFQVYAVRNVDEALKMLTGLSVGEADASEDFPEKSISGRVQKQLLEYATVRRNFGKKDLQNGDVGDE